MLQGISTIFLCLSVCFIFSNTTENIDITLANVEALATSEDYGGLEITCINTGTICMGLDENEVWGQHPGLAVKP